MLRALNLAVGGCGGLWKVQEKVLRGDSAESFGRLRKSSAESFRLLREGSAESFGGFRKDSAESFGFLK